MKTLKSLERWLASSCLSVALMASISTDALAEKITIGYMASPIHQESVKMFQKWGAANGVEIVLDSVPYNIFLEKIVSTLTSGDDTYDLIWHNDDWGQLWKDLVDPITEAAIIGNAHPYPLEAFVNDDGHNTVVPLAHTVGVFFYRNDLVSEDEAPTSWAEMVRISKKLQDEGKVKYGYVGGMAFNNTWFTWFWTMWTNKCDVLQPVFERDNAVLAKNGWTAMLDQDCMREVVEFWWDAMNTHKISPKGMPSYDRNAANAIFSSGNAAFTVAESMYYGTFNNPKKSKVAGNVSIARFPMGPRDPNGAFAWNEIWGWAIPKHISKARKVRVKEMLTAMMQDKEGQTALWQNTGAPPPNTELWAELSASDTYMQDLKAAVLDVTPYTHAAYYFPKWPAVHQAFSDTVIKAVTGAREDIAANLAAGMAEIHNAAVE